MKILHVSLWPIDEKSIGGTEKYVIELSSSLQEHSIENEVLMLSGKKTIINKVPYLPLNLNSINKLDEYSIKSAFFSDFNIGSLKKFSNIIDGCFDFSKYDLIHFNSLLFYFCAFNKTRVFTIHTNPIEFDQNWGKNSFDKMAKIIKNKDHPNTTFIAPSEHYARKYRERFGKKIMVIPHSLSKSFLVDKRVNKKRRGKWLNIFVPSRLEIKQKGQDLLLESLGLIKRDIPKFCVIFSGVDDQYKPNVKILQTMAGTFEIPVIFKKLRTDEMRDAYENADLVVLPSRYESFGYAAIESLAIGKKTVLSNIPTYNEIATGNNFAFVTKSLEPMSFGETIKKAIDFKDTIKNESWLDRYTFNKWTSAYINYYNSCLKK